MKRKEAIILFLLINISIALAAELKLEPQTISKITGEEFTIDIILENNENIYGVDFKLNNINGLNLIGYEFLNRTNNSITTVLEQGNYLRVGILFSPNTTGILPGNAALIRLTYNATDAIDSQLLFSEVFLSEENGGEVQTIKKGADITIILPSAYMSCENTYGYNGETVNVQIHANRINTDIGGVDFYQNFDSKIRYISASATAQANGMLQSNPENNKVRLALAGINLTETTHIIDVKYEIMADSGISELNFSAVEISDTNGNLLNIESNNNCEIEIEQINLPSDTGGSAGGGGGGSSSDSQNNNQNTATPGSSNVWDSFSSAIDNEEDFNEKTDEPVFYTQTKSEEKEENTETEKIDKEANKKKTKGRSLPIALITLIALIGLAVMVVFEVKK